MFNFMRMAFESPLRQCCPYSLQVSVRFLRVRMYYVRILYVAFAISRALCWCSMPYVERAQERARAAVAAPSSVVVVCRLLHRCPMP